MKKEGGKTKEPGKERNILGSKDVAGPSGPSVGKVFPGGRNCGSRMCDFRMQVSSVPQLSVSLPNIKRFLIGCFLCFRLSDLVINSGPI